MHIHCTWYVVLCALIHLDYETMVVASKEEQQRLLQGMEQHQRMSRARDVQISKLLNENEFMENKCKQVIMPRWAEPGGGSHLVCVCVCVSVCLSSLFIRDG